MCETFRWGGCVEGVEHFFEHKGHSSELRNSADPFGVTCWNDPESECVWAVCMEYCFVIAYVSDLYFSHVGYTDRN